MGTEADLARHVADYIAGMTDRFALQAHARLCGGGGRHKIYTSHLDFSM